MSHAEARTRPPSFDPHMQVLYEKADAYSAQESCQIITRSGLSKAKLSLCDLIVKSFFGGIFISLGSLFNLVVAGGSPSLRSSDPGLATFVAAFTFPIGFVLTIFTNVELVTSNMAVMMYTTLQRKTSCYDLGRNWVVSYIFNLAGCLFFAGVLSWWSNALESDAQSTYAVTQAEARVNINWGYNFTRGIGCNWLVGLAVFMSSSCRHGFSKIVGIWIPIWAL